MLTLGLMNTLAKGVIAYYKLFFMQVNQVNENLRGKITKILKI